VGRGNRSGSWGGRNSSGRRRDRAPRCDKPGFDTYDDAQQHLEEYRSRKAETGFERLPVSVQECDTCGLYHITGTVSKPARVGQMRRRRHGAGGWK
jgi:hypothetical protein